MVYDSQALPYLTPPVIAMTHPLTNAVIVVLLTPRKL
jgi:hypothetical protein